MKNNRAIFNRNTWRDSALKMRQKSESKKKNSDENEKVSFDWIY
jgi:hypothetical protein